MSTKRFTILPNDEAPIEFEFMDTSDPPVSLGVFHVTRRPRLDLVSGMGQIVTLQDGQRRVEEHTLLWLLRELLVGEMKNADGEWVAADDRQRFDALLASDRLKLDWQTLGQLVVWLTEEITEHPIGASSPSWDGRTDNGSGSKEPSDLAASA